MKTQDKLKSANELDERIREIKSFIYLASGRGFWEELTVEKRLKLKTNVKGYKEDNKGFRLDKELTYKVIEVLEVEKDRLQAELDDLFMEGSK